MAAPEFSVHVFHNGYLPAGGRTVDAIVRVSSADGPADELPGIALRVWTPRLTTVRFLKQVAPAVEDLTASRGEAGDQAGDYPTGAWAAAESRDYHLCIDIDEPARPGAEMLAARVSLIAAAAPELLALGRANVLVTWTDDDALSARVDEQVARYTGQAELPETAGPAPQDLRAQVTAVAATFAGSGFGRFTGRGRTTVVLALEEARMLNHNSIGTEHILLGLIRERQNVAARALESLGLDLAAVRQQVVAIIGQGEQAPPEHIPFTSRAKKVLELSLREALQLGHNYIGAEHILLGVIREGDGVAAQVLVKLGADLNRVREQVIQLLTAAPPAGVTEAPPAGVAGAPSAGVRATGEVERRLSAVEQRAGIAPASGDLDRQIRQAGIDKGAAVTAGDYTRAAALRDREKELLADRASRHQRWGAGPADLPSLTELAGKVRQLSEEIEQLRGLLRQQGRIPDEGT